MQRFWDKVDRRGDDECWPWTAQVNNGGYGRFWLDGKLGYAHRVSYELNVGAIPQGLEIDHLCRTRSCVNPRHLEPVTSLQNMLRGNTLVALNSAKTACIRGHEFSEENTYRYRGQRSCKTCHRLLERTRPPRVRKSRRRASGHA